MSTKSSIKWRDVSENSIGFHLYDDVMDSFCAAEGDPEPPVYLRLDGVEVEINTMAGGGASVTAVIPREAARALGLLPALGVAAVAPASLYVTCHQCDNCQHIGINDEHPTDSACNRGACGWHGPQPAEDRCPGCGEVGTMSTACPECGSHYVLLADTHLPNAGVTDKGHETFPAQTPTGKDQ